LPTGYETADVVAFLLSDSNNQPSQTWHKEKAEAMKNNPHYEVWFEKGEFVVFRRIRSMN
jgi:hypothetical protein